MKIGKLLFLCLIPFLLCGCWDQQDFEENTILLSAGIEKSQDAFIYTFVSECNSKNEKRMSVNTIKGRVLSEAIINGNKESGTPIKAGKLQTILITEDVAKNGFVKQVNNHKMEEVNRFLPDFIITECRPKEVYDTINNMKLGEQGLTYLDNLLKTAANSGYCPDIYRRDYNIDFLNQDSDPILPLISVERERPVVMGTAVFHNKKMVGKLSAEESVFLQLIVNKESHFAYTLPTPKSEKENPLVFQTNRCKSKIKTVPERDGIHIYITENINGFFDKYVWANLVETYGHDAMNTYLSHYFEKKTIDSLTLLQAMESDPLWIKKRIAAYYPDFAASHDMEESYANAKITVTAKINIKNSVNP